MGTIIGEKTVLISIMFIIIIILSIAVYKLEEFNNAG